MNTFNQLAIIPENESLSRELEVLNLEFLDLYTTHKQLIENDSVILTSLYLAKLGHLQLELLQKKTELSRLSKKIKLIQAAYNRSEYPDLQTIEKILNDELEEYYKQIQFQSQMLEKSKEVLSSLLSEEDTQKLKEIFRLLCKKLHPDLNPHQSELEKDLFIKVKAAYDLQNLFELQSILLYLDNRDVTVPTALSVNEKEQQVSFLKKNIAALKEKIEKLKETFPFNIESLINDDKQIEQKQAELKSQIREVVEDIDKCMQLLKLMLDE
ncbi:MAG: hypothetical protein PHQ11_03305 [Paludibacter sp.]|nr:hypothetical protein [Paludibacter sp.]MDD4198969.1 hypothetical protein [Paludibacter sp.]MDD4427457.1 hypothetical protein [Paludibacter sp.]